MMMTIAVDANKRLVPISGVERGLACNVFCIGCNASLMAKKGATYKHHFCHSHKHKRCVVVPESFLHLFAKEVIATTGGLRLPALPTEQNPRKLKHSWHEFEGVREEVWMQGIRPDLVAMTSDGPILIEIACTHFVDAKKLDRIASLGLRAIEIDLSAAHAAGASNDLEALKQLILHETKYKKWLHPLPVQLPVAEDDYHQGELELMPTQNQFPVVIEVVPAQTCPSLYSRFKTELLVGAGLFVFYGASYALMVTTASNLVVK